ncbi:SDR family NAD(P)-dependent oxidoreductase [Microlunatus speluncae]|uniref:SDR family NAD(P)-dependent oxidoreductase n=1 Tax=Microlunatus speluncae TaxID=2594267 RepID=UPI0012666081|nr:SDR family NAD(P)-dependent oxidoreductase [Microlunatus speluncae]
MDIEGRRAVVTGGAIGTGRAVAIALAAAGAEVVVADIDEVGGRETVDRAGADRCRFVRTDLTDPQQTADLITSTRPRILINNAGGGGHLPPHFPEASAEEWERLLTLNLIGPMRATQHALVTMRSDGGVIVNISSIAGLGLGPHPSPEYSAAKAGVIRFTATLADVAPARVVCLVPDWVATERVTDAELASDPPPIPIAAFTDAVLGLIADDSLAGRVMLLPQVGQPQLLA